MGNRIFVGVVVLLWAGTMSWLMVARILPPFFHGEPPAHGAPRPRRAGLLGDRVRAGRSAMRSARRSRARWARRKSTAACCWRESTFASWRRNGWGAWCAGMGEISLDTRTRAGARFARQPVVVRHEGAAQRSAAGDEGAGARRRAGAAAEDSIGRRHARGELPGSVANRCSASELIPEPKLLQVYVGRKWQQEVYSPFRPPTNSMEMMQAEVVEEGSIEHNGERPRSPERSSFAACRRPAWRPTTRCGPWCGSPTTARCCGRTCT